MIIDITEMLVSSKQQKNIFNKKPQYKKNNRPNNIIIGNLKEYQV